MEILFNMKDLNNNPQDRSKITLENFRCKGEGIINLSQWNRQLIVPITYKRNICLIANITTIWRQRIIAWTILNATMVRETIATNVLMITSMCPFVQVRKLQSCVMAGWKSLSRFPNWNLRRKQCILIGKASFYIAIRLTVNSREMKDTKRRNEH